MSKVEITSIDDIQQLYHKYKMYSDIHFNKYFLIVLGLVIVIYFMPFFLEKIDIILSTKLFVLIKTGCFIVVCILLIKRIYTNYFYWISILILGTNSICNRNNLPDFNIFSAKEKDICNFLIEVSIGNIMVLEQDKIFAGDLLEFYRVRSKLINFLK